MIKRGHFKVTNKVVIVYNLSKLIEWYLLWKIIRNSTEQTVTFNRVKFKNDAVPHILKKTAKI